MDKLRLLLHTVCILGHSPEAYDHLVLWIFNMGEVLGIGVDKVVFLEVARLVALRDLHNLGQRGISKLNVEFFKFPEKSGL